MNIDAGSGAESADESERSPLDNRQSILESGDPDSDSSGGCLTQATTARCGHRGRYRGGGRKRGSESRCSNRGG